jgi:uncharacterized protein (TIGR02996 family)
MAFSSPFRVGCRIAGFRTGDKMITDPVYLGLLQEIIARPADDWPRLVFCDWLEDHDLTMHARYIRTTIAGLPDIPLPHWAYPLHNFQSDWSWDWKRGFVSSVETTWQQWREHGHEVIAWQPIEVVRLTGKEPRHMDGHEWTWCRWSHFSYSPADHPASNLDDELFELLDGYTSTWGGHGSDEDEKDACAKHYKDRASADTALSRACLLFARQDRERRGEVSKSQKS